MDRSNNGFLQKQKTLNLTKKFTIAIFLFSINSCAIVDDYSFLEPNLSGYLSIENVKSIDESRSFTLFNKEDKESLDVYYLSAFPSSVFSILSPVLINGTITLPPTGSINLVFEIKNEELMDCEEGKIHLTNLDGCEIIRAGEGKKICGLISLRSSGRNGFENGSDINGIGCVAVEIFK